MVENDFGRPENQLGWFHRLNCDFKSLINIVHYLIQCDRTKHIEVDKIFYYVFGNRIKSQGDERRNLPPVVSPCPF